EVCEHIITECRRANCPPDLRLLDNSCLDYLQWESGYSQVHWRDLVTSRVQQSAAHFRYEVNTLGRGERLARERDVMRDITQQTDLPSEQERLWKERTGKGKSSFYNRKREIDSREFDV